MWTCGIYKTDFRVQLVSAISVLYMYIKLNKNPEERLNEDCLPVDRARQSGFERKCRREGGACGGGDRNGVRLWITTFPNGTDDYNDGRGHREERLHEYWGLMYHDYEEPFR